jgi:hypothetical protein
MLQSNREYGIEAHANAATNRSEAILPKPIFPQLVKKFPASYGT